jgi:hypothetical protein
LQRDPKSPQPARAAGVEKTAAGPHSAAVDDLSPRGRRLGDLIQMIARSPRSARHTQWQAGLGAAAASRPVVQRMVAIATPNLSSEDDALVLANLDYALGHFKGPVGDFNANRKFDQTQAGDRVAIVAHGGAGSIGLNPSYDAQAVADALTSAPGGPIDKELASITLYSCNAGMDMKDSNAGGNAASLADGVSAALDKKGYHIGVSGQKGVAFGFKGIGERTTRGDEKTGDNAWFPTRDKLLAQPQYSRWGSPGKGFHTATTILVAEGHDRNAVSKMSLELKGQLLSDILAPFWRDAEKAMGPALYDHLKGWVDVARFASGGMLVQDSR